MSYYNGLTPRDHSMTEAANDSRPVLFKDQTAVQLQARLAGLGVSLRVARRLQAAVLQRGATEAPAALSEVPRRLLEQVRQATVVPRLKRVEKITSPTDGFTKYLFQGDGPEPFESVRILRLLEQVRQATVVPRLKRVEKITSPTDGFTKYLFQGDGPEPFESVRIPLL